MAPRYRVALTETEREYLLALTRNGKTGTKKFINARALLLYDAGPAWNVANVAEALGVTSPSIFGDGRTISVYLNIDGPVKSQN
jgi:hypothetical protein